MGRSAERPGEDRQAGRTHRSRTTIVITDGDAKAVRTIKRVAAETGVDTIAETAGSPTRVTPDEVLAAIERSKAKLVLVMVDDGGDIGYTGPCR